MDDRIVIHPTTLGRTSCRLHYHWSRSYKPVGDSPALSFGLAIHEALEEYYGAGKDPVQAFQRYVHNHPEDDIDMELGIVMLENYLEHYANEQFKVLATEMEIARRVPVPDDDPDPPERAKRFYVAARVDGIVRDLSIDKIFALEHKTFEKFYLGSLPRDQQFVIEAFVTEGYYKEPIAGVLYNGLRKRYKKTKTTNLFERHPIYINDHSIRTMLHRVYWTLMELTADHFPVYPEPATMNCVYCKFKNPCTEYIRGGDWRFILDNVYDKRKADDDYEWV